jgi:hypothetical protein
MRAACAALKGHAMLEKWKTRRHKYRNHKGHLKADVLMAQDCYDALKASEALNAELLEALEIIAKQDCEYTNSAGCDLLPAGVVRSVCNPCRARAAIAKAK